MPSIQYGSVKEPNHDNAVSAKIYKFIHKLTKDDTSLGLHIEPIKHSADPRARTGRVDGFWRAVLYRTDWPGGEVMYVYAGTWAHDVAIERARTRVLRQNPVHGTMEFVTVSAEKDSVAKSNSVWANGESLNPTEPYLAARGYVLAELVDQLGIKEEVALQLFSFTEVGQIEVFSESRENAWEQVAILGLAFGDTIEQIRSELQLDDVVDENVALRDGEKFAKAFDLPASRMQFTFVDGEEELRRVIEGKNFDAWRVFLHPEQLKYVEADQSGSFRLTGGAGTGKTVVLLHRTRRLAARDPQAKIVLTTFTRALSDALDRSLTRLNPSIPRAAALGDSGVLVRGIDQLASAVRDQYGAAYWSASADVFAVSIEPRFEVTNSETGWKEAISASGADLPKDLRNVSFLDSEYTQVILPGRVTSREEYFAIARPGRRIPLDRRKRAAVWGAVEEYRRGAERAGRLSYDEVAAIATATLNRLDAFGRPSDHVLVDEGQDLSPLHWQLLRALAPVGRNDLFISEDSHQRIYGKPIVVSRFDVAIRGRSRRLTLNYRTTHEVLDFAMTTLEGSVYIDSEDQTDMTSGYRSSRTGPKPSLLACEDDEAQIAAIALEIQRWLAAGVAPESIAVLVRSNKLRDIVKSQLAILGVEVQSVDSGEGSGKLPVVMTMHLAKGQEFSRVVVFDMSAKSIPPKWSLQSVPPEEADQAIAAERSLLYVATTRARDELVVTWSGRPTDLFGLPQALKQ